MIKKKNNQTNKKRFIQNRFEEMLTEPGHVKLHTNENININNINNSRICNNVTF